MAEKKNIQMSGAEVRQAYDAEMGKYDAIARQIQALGNLARENALAKEALKAIEDTKEGDEIMVSVGGGIYVEAKLKNIREVQSALAGGTLVRKKIAAVKAELTERKKSIDKEIERLSKERQTAANNMDMFAQVMNRAQRKVAEAQSQAKAKAAEGAKGEGK